MTSDTVTRGAELVASGKYKPGAFPELPKGWLLASDAPRSRPTDWLVRDCLARRHVTYLYGEEGIGKSTWWVYEVAKLTQDGHYVIVIFTEDGWEDTLRPRMEAAGVDLAKVLLFDASDEDDDDFDPGIPGPNYLLAQEGLPDVSLVIVDGLADAATASNAGNLPKATEWRPVINAWKRYARRHNLAVLALGHTNRDTLNGTRGAVGLSGQIRQTVRHNMLALRDEDGRLAIGTEKSNIARTDAPVDLFDVVEVETPNGVTITIAKPAGIGEHDAKTLFSVMAAQSQVAEDDAARERLDGCLADLVGLVREHCDDPDGWIWATSAQELLQKGQGDSKVRWTQAQVDRARTDAVKGKHIETNRPVNPGPWRWRCVT